MDVVVQGQQQGASIHCRGRHWKRVLVVIVVGGIVLADAWELIARSMDMTEILIPIQVSWKSPAMIAVLY